MASSSPRQAAPAEALASERAELLAQLLNAQTDLASQVQELRRNGGSEVLTAAEAQLSELSQVQQRLASGTISVAALRSEVTAIVAAATSVTAQARVSANSQAQHAEATLAAASVEARRTVDAFMTDFYEKKVFDPYLRFASAEDEAAYREREEARRQAITEAQAERTPVATLRATRLAQDQLRDAGAHGATDSPDYASTMARLDKAGDALESAIAHSEPGREAQQPATAAVDPLDAIQATSAVPPELLAALRESGVTMPDQQVTGHGVRGTQAPTPSVYLS